MILEGHADGALKSGLGLHIAALGCHFGRLCLCQKALILHDQEARGNAAVKLFHFNLKRLFLEFPGFRGGIIGRPGSLQRDERGFHFEPDLVLELVEPDLGLAQLNLVARVVGLGNVIVQRQVQLDADRVSRIIMAEILCQRRADSAKKRRIQPCRS